jgi:hypothetical protein
MDQNQPTDPQEPQPETWVPEVIDQPETPPAQPAQDDFVVVDIEPEEPGEPPLQPEIVSGPGYSSRPPASASAPPPPRKSNAGIITLIIVLLLLCCCCLASFAVLWFIGDIVLGIFGGIVQFVIDLLNSIFGSGFIQIY